MNVNYISSQAAVQLIKSGDRVFVHGSAATPLSLVDAMFQRAGEIENIEIVSISTLGNINWNTPEVKKSFRLNSLFVSTNVREWANSETGDYIPIFLSEIPHLFNSGLLPIDVAILQVSPPDKHGYCTLGTSIDAALSAAKNAKKVIAQINPRMPRTHGDGQIHISSIDAAVYESSELPEVNYSEKLDANSMKIGQFVANLIENGSTLQMGIGGIPDAVLKCLTQHKGLGIHTEMFSDGVVPLVESGVITNEFKKVLPGKIVTSFAIGTRKVYDFIDDNPIVSFLNVAFVNDTATIRKNPKVVAINSALEIDITGQICADSIGTYQYSGIGGQMDFMRGSSLSIGGKPVIALPSITGKGISRIVPALKSGAGVVTTRGHVHFVVTEFGVVDLYGQNLEQRARLLISIANPQHKEELEKAFFERFKKLL